MGSTSISISGIGNDQSENGGLLDRKTQCLCPQSRLPLWLGLGPETGDIGHLAAGSDLEAWDDVENGECSVYSGKSE